MKDLTPKMYSTAIPREDGVMVPSDPILAHDTAHATAILQLHGRGNDFITDVNDIKKKNTSLVTWDSMIMPNALQLN